MTKEEMWKEFENQLVRETRTPMTMSYDTSEKMIKSAIKETVAKWKERLEQQPSDDCVSLQAIINMTGLSNWFESSDDYNNFVWELGKLPPVTPTQRWIPVSEELPKKNMPCLVSVGSLNLTQIAIYSDLMYTIDHKIFYQGDYGHDSFRDITKYVKAWMPLPKPYEEKRGRENG